MGRFRKKPVEVEATQWFKNGDHPEDESEVKEGKVVRYFRRPDVDGESVCKKCNFGDLDSSGRTMHEHGWIDTLEGGHIVCPGDFIITGVQGERYPCKPDIFEATYEEVCTDPEDAEDIAAIEATKHEATHDWNQLKESLGLDEDADRELDEMERHHAALHPCTVPPEGWSCSRGSGHEGPCAAKQLATTRATKGKPMTPERLAKLRECWEEGDCTYDDQEEMIGALEGFISYANRMNHLTASMAGYLQEAAMKHARMDLTFMEAWLSSFDDPEAFPEVTKIIAASKS